MSFKLAAVIVRVVAETKGVLAENVGHPAHPSVIRVWHALIAHYRLQIDQQTDRRYTLLPVFASRMLIFMNHDVHLYSSRLKVCKTVLPEISS